MNQRPLNTAYEGMANTQLAAAAYAHADNELESLRIQSAVLRKTYSMIDAQFIHALENIYTVGLVWSREYWRLQHVSAVIVLRMAHAYIQGEIKDEGKHAQSIIHSQQMLAAHFEALREVCEVHGVDYRAILKKNQIAEDFDKAIGVDLKFKAWMMEVLEELFVVRA